MRYITALAVAVAVYLGIGAPAPEATAVLPGGYQLDPQLARILWSILAGGLSAVVANSNNPIVKKVGTIIMDLLKRFLPADSIDEGMSNTSKEIVTVIIGWLMEQDDEELQKKGFEFAQLVAKAAKAEKSKVEA